MQKYRLGIIGEIYESMDKILSSLIFLALIPGAAFAQITPDSSLGAENSVVETNGNRDTIKGGAIRDANLFHSFQEFNVEAGKEAYFTNPDGITNIFSRVTGNDISDIHGVLGVLDGNANLFFLNPNGIIFGENASLDVGGSFVASTSNAIQFGDRGWFSATDPEQPPLLTVQPSAFFFNQMKAGRIENRSTAPAGVDLLGRPVFGLRVPDGQSLLLLGGDIAFNGGRLHALGGKLELAGVVGEGIVGLNVNDNNISLSFPETLERADVSLTNRAQLDVRAGGGGSIRVNARNLELKEGSRLLAGIRSDFDSPGVQAGDIEINATDTVFFEGTSMVDNEVESNAVGNAGNIDITTGSLAVIDGAQVSSSTLGEGNAGTVSITASDSVVFDRKSSQNTNTGAFSRVEPGAKGNAGGISITTGSLYALNGTEISASTGGEGDAGTVTITATDSVVFDAEDGNEFGSGAFSQVFSEAKGNAGGISVTTGSLQISGGSELSVTTGGEGNAGSVTITANDSILIDGESSNGNNSGVFSSVDGQGNAGEISVTTNSLNLTNGGVISTSTRQGGEGNAGKVMITATDSILLDGQSRLYLSGIFSLVRANAQGNAGGVEIFTDSLSVTNNARISTANLGEGLVGNIVLTAKTLEVNTGGRVVTGTGGRFNGGDINLIIQDSITLTGANSGLFANTIDGSEGNGGKIFTDPRTNPRTIIIRDGAQIAVDSQGSGEGGEIQLQADSLTLENQASISAETASNTGGNITLKIQDLLLLRRGSNISATAGLAQREGDGGNITIETPLLVAFPQENSDIKANAFAGNGGNINIDTQNIFGFELQEDSKFSDITASSRFGIDGTVNINTSGIEPGQELSKLPIEIVDVSGLINQNLCSVGQEGEFIITGKGGLSPSPKDTLNTDAGWEDWRVLENSSSNYQQSSQTRSLPEVNDRDPHHIVEAQSWFRAPNGNIVLTAQPVKSVSRSSPFVPLNCQLLDELPK